MRENAHFLVLRSPPLAQYEPDRRATSQIPSPIYVARIELIKRWVILSDSDIRPNSDKMAVLGQTRLIVAGAPPRLVVRMLGMENQK